VFVNIPILLVLHFFDEIEQLKSTRLLL